MQPWVRAAMLAALVWAAGGCGGYYTLTLSDHVAAAGDTAVIVARLHRNDFFVLDLPMRGMPMRFRIGGGEERGGYTDKIGYAGTTVPTPDVPGRYLLTADVSDHEGEEVGSQAYAYVWEADKPVLAVDLSCLPDLAHPQRGAAKAVLERFAKTGHVLYVTRKAVKEHELAHSKLMACGYPDGPVLLWRRERWHLVTGKYKMPYVVVESRLVSQLAEIKKVFPKLQRGLCDSDIAAEAFVAAGLSPAVVGKSYSTYLATCYDSWQALDAEGFRDQTVPAGRAAPARGVSVPLR